MKLFRAERLASPQILLTLIAPVVLLASGCSKTEPTATTSANSVSQSMADKIKSVENDPRMPADVKAAEIERIKAAARGS